MADAMRHRGPDDLGFYLSPDCRVGLTTRRLSIRDLSPAGHMPMGTGTGDVWITYNGEIYNADELRADLERQGHRFRSHSDTEVILQGYCTWGNTVVERLRGMFAFGIHDRRPQAGAGRLLLARDCLGIKPLYYAKTSDGVVFGSELKAIRASGLVSGVLSPAALGGDRFRAR
ncbi:MAG: hypothetical protein HYS05_13830 [Acidobacteria bacterium]|nr:hypothetical protein [Acidobacteriota bacterium]